MTIGLVGPRQMGRPRKEIEAASTRLEKDAYELARTAASFYGESIVVYISRVVRNQANIDIDSYIKARESKSLGNDQVS